MNPKEEIMHIFSICMTYTGSRIQAFGLAYNFTAWLQISLFFYTRSHRCVQLNLVFFVPCNTTEAEQAHSFSPLSTKTRKLGLQSMRSPSPILVILPRVHPHDHLNASWRVKKIRERSLQFGRLQYKQQFWGPS